MSILPTSLPKSKLPRKLVFLAEQRAKICEPCLESRGVSLIVNSFEVYRVKCNACGCPGMSLIGGTCPLNQWNKES